MPDQTPIPITDLVTPAMARLSSKSEDWQARVRREIVVFAAACTAAGLTHLPDERVGDLARSFVTRATTTALVPSESMKSMRRASIRALLRAAVGHGLLVKDPFAVGYDRVLAGQDFGVVIQVKGYMPKDLPAEAWERVRPTFEDWVPRAIAANPAIGYSALAYWLSRHLVWCEGEAIPLQPRRALDYVNINRHLGALKLPANTASPGRSVLGRAGDALAPTFRLTPQPRPTRLNTYSEADVDALVRWVLSIARERAAARAWEVLVFGLGVGFDAPAMRHLRGTHVTRRGRFVVAYDPTDRQHPVAFLPRWEEEGFRLAEAAGDGYLIHPALTNRMDKNLVAGIIAQLGTPPRGCPSFDSRRLRATWVLHQLNAGVGAAVVLGAAGLTSFSSLDRYLPFLEWPGDDEAFRLLRGEE